MNSTNHRNIKDVFTMKKILPFIFIISLLLNTTVFALNNLNDDITSHDYEESIRDLIKRGIVTLDSNGNFYPDRCITAAELFSMYASFVRKYKDYIMDCSISEYELQQYIFTDEIVKDFDIFMEMRRKNEYDLPEFNLINYDFQLHNMTYLQAINKQGLDLSKDKPYYEDCLYIGKILKENVQRDCFFSFRGKLDIMPELVKYFEVVNNKNVFTYNYNKMTKAEVFDVLYNINLNSKLPEDDKINYIALMHMESANHIYSINDLKNYEELDSHPLLHRRLKGLYIFDNSIDKYVLDLARKQGKLDDIIDPYSEMSKAETAYLLSNICNYFDMRILRAKLKEDPNYRKTQISIPFWVTYGVSPGETPIDIDVYIKTNKLCTVSVDKELFLKLPSEKTFIRFGEKDFNEEVGILDGYWQYFRIEMPTDGIIKVLAIDEAGNKTRKSINIFEESHLFEFE